MRQWLAAATLGVAVLALGAQLPEGEGKKTLETACTACHTLDVVMNKHWSEQRWRQVVDAMIDRGAEVSNEQAPVVVQYLVKNFGPAAGAAKADRGRELVQDICSLCHELDRIRYQHLSKDDWAELIKGMISEGAPVTDEEFSMIVEYLAKNFGPRQGDGNQ